MKNIVITGATSGIGLALAEKLSSKNKLILTFHQNPPIKKLNNSIYYQLDLNNDQSIEDFIKKIGKKPIDIWINNAGICIDKKLNKTNFSEIETQINTNLTGMIKLTSKLIHQVKKQIINIGSQYSIETYPEYSVYCASKFGVRGFTQALAKEYENLLINCVNPGATSTKMNGFYGTAPTEVASFIIDKLIYNHSIKSGKNLNVYKKFKI
jgi:short-subunit dehydrogenase